MSSLEKFFETCSRFHDRQIIIFTSVDKVLDNEDSEKLDIYKILDGIPKENYNLIELDKENKAIKKLI